jgi:uncharacterized membrane protein
LRDTGIKTGEMNEITENLKVGEVALIVLAEPPSIPSIERTMEGWAGYIVRHGFSAEESEHLERAAEEAEAAAPPVEIPRVVPQSAASAGESAEATEPSAPTS